ncbi:shikimate kinase [Kribbella sp. VKM Ac-2571]|uniref:AAA family ATPase n=1 Tax=Kribbella sp. VKM Ac-2571 TaxID=2512222 RepID=UPI001060D127|nr:AAA family ATPase [Kribbella sp. VKM Ac-2571]TDO49690.1 shikimate kinase [Kribbella sp. VKM Ac-2571]
MTRILITGMSGTGKTTLLDELARRGHHTVDTDYDGWTQPDGTWHEQRMSDLLAGHSDVIVSGTVENQGKFYNRFEHVVLLTAPLGVLIERVTRRTNNPYGRTPEQQAEIAYYAQSVEPLLRAGATLELDARQPVVDLAAVIDDLANRR